MKQKWKSYITSALFLSVILLMLFVPAAKATVIQGLMQIGLFNPSVKENPDAAPNNLAAVKFKDVNGKVVSLADLKGKIIFLNFWATWCPPCLAEMPSVNKLYQQFKNDEDVVFLLVDADSDFAKANAYMSRKQYQMPVYNVASSMPETIFKGSLPTTIVFDKMGRISFNTEGAANYASPKFIAFIKKLQQQKN